MSLRLRCARIASALVRLAVVFGMLMPQMPSVAVADYWVGNSASQAFLWPVQGKGFSLNVANSPFRPSSRPNHNGLDISPSTVLATKDGYVTGVFTECDPSKGCKPGTENGLEYNCLAHRNGNYVQITHADGYVSWYLHLKYNNVYVTNGQHVTQGQALGYAGNTGQSRGAHLHFGIKRSGSWVNSNPQRWTACAGGGGMGDANGLAYTYSAQHANHVYWTDWSTAGHPHIAKCTTCPGVTQGGAQYSGACAQCAPPAAPAVVNLSSADVGVGRNVTASWSGVGGAAAYVVKLTCLTDESKNLTTEVNATSASFTLSKVASYTISVQSKNSAGKSSPTPAVSKPIRVHPDVRAAFVDHDGTLLCEQTIGYGGSVKAPIAPSRDGYTFQGWSRDLSNVTADTSITPVYLINSYTVRFIGAGGQVVSTQKVEHGASASSPSSPTPPARSVFVGWENADHQCVTSNQSVNAVFALENPDLPIYSSITSATRDTQSKGYAVRVSLTNDSAAIVRGRLIVTLKTAAGKMVESEDENFSVGATGTVTRDIYIPYEGLATKAELSVVGVTAGGNTGSPLAIVRTADVNIGESWSAWSADQPPAGSQVQTRTEYRYRDKSTASGANPVMTGWTLVNTTWVWGPWSAWGTYNPGATADREVVTRSLETPIYKTQWRYGRFLYNGGANSSANPPSGYTYSFQLSNWSDYEFTWIQTYSGGSAKYRDQGTGVYWYRSPNYSGYGPYTQSVYAYSNWTKQWQYREKAYTYWFERWGDWSDWASTASTPTAARAVETRTAYRFKTGGAFKTAYNYKRYRYQNMNNGQFYYTYSAAWPDSQGWPGQWVTDKRYVELAVARTTPEGVKVYNADADPWYSADVNAEGPSGGYITQDSLEDTGGRAYTVTGTVAAVGKRATLMVFKGANIDPTASQLEYVSQTTIGSDGRYSFTFTPKEEPSLGTGDYYVMLGVQGANAPVLVDTIEAPKPTYSVQFVDADGRILDYQTVFEGDSVTPPSPPQVDGAEFIGWSVGTTNIHDDLTVVARYATKAHSVVFVNWRSNSLETRSFEHGKPVVAPTAEVIEGEDFVAWVDSEQSEPTTVTSDLVLYAKYQPRKHTVIFLDADGSVLDSQTVEHGKAAVRPEKYGYFDAPAEEVAAEAGYMRLAAAPSEVTTATRFGGWTQDLELDSVEQDLVVAPLLAESETVATPVPSTGGGAYTDSRSVALSSATTDTVIYFTTDGTEPYYEEGGDPEAWNGRRYTGTPIVIEGDTLLKAVGYKAGLNPSNTMVESYRIRPMVTLNLISDQPAAGTVSGGGSYPQTSLVTVTATPSQGQYFLKWMDGESTVSTSSEFAFELTEPRTLTAVFSAMPVIALAAEGGHGKVFGGGKKLPGEAVSAVAVADAGYRFLGWFEGDVLVSAQPILSFVMEGDRALVARFAPLPVVSLDVADTYLGSANIEIAASGPGIASVGYKMDDEPTVTVSAAAIKVAESRLGLHSIRAWATDASGYVGETRTRTFVVESETKVGLAATDLRPLPSATTTLVASVTRVPGDSPVPSACVVIERFEQGAWSSIATLTCDTQGQAKLALTNPGGIVARYRATHVGSAGYRPATSATMTVLPKAQLRRTTSWTTLTRGKTYYARGSVSPTHTVSDPGKIKILAYQRRSNGSYRYVKSFVAVYGATADGRTSYSARVLLSSNGNWKLVAYHAADTRNAAAYGDPDYVTVR